jgi:Flp pilus assembly pilin Flp
MPMALLFGFLRSESAASLITYGLVAAGIALAIINFAQALGMDLNGTFSRVASLVK